MKKEEIKGKTMDELHKALLDTRKTQMNMRFQRAQGQLEKTHEIKKLRKDVARIKTALSAQRANEKSPAKAAKKAFKAKTVKSKKAA